jgi:hypothetical protein
MARQSARTPVSPSARQPHCLAGSAFSDQHQSGPGWSSMQPLCNSAGAVNQTAVLAAGAANCSAERLRLSLAVLPVSLCSAAHVAEASYAKRAAAVDMHSARRLGLALAIFSTSLITPACFNLAASVAACCCCLAELQSLFSQLPHAVIIKGRQGAASATMPQCWDDVLSAIIDHQRDIQMQYLTTCRLLQDPMWCQV